MWPSYNLGAKNHFCLVSPQSNYLLCVVQGRTKGRGATYQVSLSLPFCTMDCLLMQSFCDRQQWNFFFHLWSCAFSFLYHPFLSLGRVETSAYSFHCLFSHFLLYLLLHHSPSWWHRKKHSLVPTYGYHLMTSKLMIPFIIMTCNILFETTSSLYLFSDFLPPDFSFHSSTQGLEPQNQYLLFIWAVSCFLIALLINK